jgi:hypothetical protein
LSSVPYFFFLDEELFRGLLRFERDDFAGTLAPERLASERPMAIACLRLFTFLPERPLLRVPRFLSCIARRTFCWDFLPYLAIARRSCQCLRVGSPPVRRLSRSAPSASAPAPASIEKPGNALAVVATACPACGFSNCSRRRVICMPSSRS